MSLFFFTVPALDAQERQDEFNAFCCAHRVVQIDRHFVADGPGSYWALCVTVANGVGPLPAALRKQGQVGESATAGKVDYKQVLSADDFTVFAALRQLRKSLAEQAGMPLYAVFSNEQLAVMARQRCATAADLGAVDGVGPARVQRFGGSVLACIAEHSGVPAAPL